MPWVEQYAAVCSLINAVNRFTAIQNYYFYRYYMLAGKIYNSSPLFNRIWLAVFYLVVSVAIGEVHPFSSLPMYRVITDYSDVFYLADKNGKVVPLKKASLLPSAFINKHYHTYLNEHGLTYDDIKSNAAEREKLGYYVFNRTVDFKTAKANNYTYLKLVLSHGTMDSSGYVNVVLYEHGI